MDKLDNTAASLTLSGLYELPSLMEAMRAIMRGPNEKILPRFATLAAATDKDTAKANLAAVLADTLEDNSAKLERAAYEATARTSREYQPKASILASDTLRNAAQAVGPDFFGDLVKEAESMIATGRAQPVPESALAVLGLPQRPSTEEYERARNAGERAPFAKNPTPYSFIAALALRVARGEMFAEDVEFDRVIQKGGTLAEWSFNAARFVKSRTDRGEIKAGALSQDVRHALGRIGERTHI